MQLLTGKVVKAIKLAEEEARDLGYAHVGTEQVRKAGRPLRVAPPHPSLSPLFARSAAHVSVSRKQNREEKASQLPPKKDS